MATWIYHVSTDPKELERFVNGRKPRIDGIQGTFYDENYFHVWIREGDESRERYQLLYTDHWQKQTDKKDGTGIEIAHWLENKRLVILGFNGENPPRVWYFEQQFEE